MNKILFLCSKNKMRSPTAEIIFKKYSSLEVKSAGTSEVARIKVTEKLLNWADIIFVMEKRHKSILQKKFHHILGNKNIIILDIPDNYSFMSEELIEILEDSVLPYIEDFL
jgi:protein-tyrosine phosphatase